MRISTSWSQQLNINAMQNQQAGLNKTQLQISTGLKNLTPADDPVAGAKGLNLQAILDQNTQYQENINVAKNGNALEDSTLNSIVDILQKARELAVQSLNTGTLTDADKKSIGQEVPEILGNILALAGTTTANGEYIFSGYKSKTAPFKEDATTTPKTYTYEGDAGQRFVQVSRDLQVATNDPGSDVFQYTDSAGNPQNIFNTLSTFAQQLANPNAATDQTVLTKVLNDLDGGLNQISDTRAKTGARLNVLDAQKAQHDQHSVELKSNLSDVQDVDYAEAISRMNQQQMVLQAAQQSYSKVQKLSLFDYL